MDGGGTSGFSFVNDGGRADGTDNLDEFVKFFSVGEVAVTRSKSRRQFEFIG